MGNALTLTVEGKSAELLPTVAKSTQNTYWVLNGQPQAARFGIKVPAMAKSLPSSVTIAGTTIELKAGVSPSSNKPQVANHSAPVTVDGCPKRAKVVINDHGDGNWQVIAAVFSPGGGSSAAPNTSLFA